MRTRGLSQALFASVTMGMLACSGTPEVAETYGQTSLAVAADGAIDDGAAAVAEAAVVATDAGATDAAPALEATVVAEAAADAPLEADGGEAGPPSIEAGSDGGADGGGGADAHGNNGSGITATRDAGGMFGTFDETHFSPSTEGGCSTGEPSRGPAPLGLLGALAVLGWMVALRRRS